jgi:endonuclease-3
MNAGRILDRLEAHYGIQAPEFPADPYLFLVWWTCGYPASDAACLRGWESLSQRVGTGISDVLSASVASLTAALKPGGMLPDQRALRLLEIAERVQKEFGGDLVGALKRMPLEKARVALKKFHSIADAGADRILLFGGVAPLAAVPSNCVRVLLRIARAEGDDPKNFSKSYREASALIASATAEKFDARSRAYLLVKRHGQEVCKLSKPRCGECVVRDSCAFGRAEARLRSRSSAPH